MRNQPVPLRPGEESAQAGVGAVDRRRLRAVLALAVQLPLAQLAVEHERHIKAQAVGVLPPGDESLEVGTRCSNGRRRHGATASARAVLEIGEILIKDGRHAGLISWIADRCLASYHYRDFWASRMKSCILSLPCLRHRAEGFWRR